MAYTPPLYNAVDFETTTGYTPPAYNAVDADLGVGDETGAVVTGEQLTAYAGQATASGVAETLALPLAYADRTTEIFSRKAVLPRTSDGNVVLSFSNKVSKTVVSDASTTQEVNR